MPAQVGFGQTVNAQLPAKAAAIEREVSSASAASSTVPRRIGLDARACRVRFVEPKVDAGQIACSHRTPGKRRAGGRLPHDPLRIEKVHRRKPRDAIARNCQFAFPQRLAATAPISAPCHNTRTRRPRSGAVGTKRLRDRRSVQDIDPFDRRGSDHFGSNPHRHTARANDVSHPRTLHRKFRPVRAAGPRKTGDGLVERSVQIEKDPGAGRSVVAPLPQCLEQCIARQLRHEIAGKSTDRAKTGRARAGRAGRPL